MQGSNPPRNLAEKAFVFASLGSDESVHLSRLRSEDVDKHHGAMKVTREIGAVFDVEGFGAHVLCEVVSRGRYGDS